MPTSGLREAWNACLSGRKSRARRRCAGHGVREEGDRHAVAGESPRLVRMAPDELDPAARVQLTPHATPVHDERTARVPR